MGDRVSAGTFALRGFSTPARGWVGLLGQPAGVGHVTNQIARDSHFSRRGPLLSWRFSPDGGAAVELLAILASPRRSRPSFGVSAGGTTTAWLAPRAWRIRVHGGGALARRCGRRI